MNNGSYGTIRMSDVAISDIDVYYTYMGNRGSQSPVAKKLNASDVITKVKTDTGTNLKGLYTLKLPKDVFTAVGIYNILITPKGITTKIVDNGTLSSRPDVRGIIIDINDPNITQARGRLVNSGLDGYRIEYKNKDNIYRIVTSSNKCEPINDVSMSTTQKQVRYRISELSNLMFLTLTPSGSNDIKVNSSAFLGEVNDEITIYNTHFDPVMLEVELVETTLDTLKDYMFGNQIETKDGKLTIYSDDEEKRPIKEYNLLVLKDEMNKDIARIKMGTEISSETNFDDNIDNINRT